MSDEKFVIEAIGKEGISRMVAGFYRRVKTDDLLAPMYPRDDWEGSESRLRDFLLFRIAGDSTYILKRGHPRLRMRHMPFRIGVAERDRWLALIFLHESLHFFILWLNRSVFRKIFLTLLAFFVF